jgi:hypothetical protein
VSEPIIMSPRGQSYVELGGERAWLQRVKGDICITYQWLNTGKSEPSACMVLFPIRAKMDGGAYAIPQENAYEYATAEGKATPYLMVAAFNAAQSMGFFPDKSTVHRVVDAIIDGLSDLVRMPSEQPGQLDIKALLKGIEAKVKVNGQVFREEVI